VDCLGANGDKGSGDNWSYKMCKAPVRLSPSSTQRFYRLLCPSCCPTNSVRAL